MQQSGLVALLHGRWDGRLHGHSGYAVSVAGVMLLCCLSPIPTKQAESKASPMPHYQLLSL